VKAVDRYLIKQSTKDRRLVLCDLACALGKSSSEVGWSRAKEWFEKAAELRRDYQVSLTGPMGDNTVLIFGFR
jgi:hypothetical protein